MTFLGSLPGATSYAITATDWGVPDPYDPGVSDTYTYTTSQTTSAFRGIPTHGGTYLPPGETYSFSVTAARADVSGCSAAATADGVQVLPDPGPAIVPGSVAATENPDQTFVTLTVLGEELVGAQDYEPFLIYTWSVTSTPAGGDALFDDNDGTNAGKTVVATLTAAGDYTFCVAVADEGRVRPRARLLPCAKARS